MLARLRLDPGYRRKTLLRGTGIAIGAVSAGAAALTALAFELAPDLASGIGLAGDVLVGAALLLAAIAAVTALLAYAVSTGVPELQVSVRFPRCEVNVPEFWGAAAGGKLTVTEGEELLMAIYLRNISEYPARSPAVSVRLKGLHFAVTGNEGPWAVTDYQGTQKITAIQWDGGPSYSVHGGSVRRLPELLLEGLTYTAGYTVPGRKPVLPKLEIQILAEGYRREVTIPVKLKTGGEKRIPGASARSVPLWL